MKKGGGESTEIKEEGRGVSTPRAAQKSGCLGTG